MELKIAATGLGWDDRLGTIRDDNDWWKNHLQKHPEHAKYRNAGPAYLEEMDIMFDNNHVTGASSVIPGEILEDTNEELNPIDVDETDDDADLTVSAMKKAKIAKRKAKKDGMPMQEDKNPFLRVYKKAMQAITTSVEATSSNKTPSSTTPNLASAMVMIRECGVEEGTPLFYTATKLILKSDFRELFALIDWLQRALDEEGQVDALLDY